MVTEFIKRLLGSNCNYYYHATDMFSIPSILNRGLKCSYDGNIYLYKGNPINEKIINLIYGRKLLASLCLQNRLRHKQIRIAINSFYNYGIGIVAVKAKTIRFSRKQVDVMGKNCFCVKMARIEPENIIFMGFYDEKTQTLKNPPLSLETYNRIYEEYILPAASTILTRCSSLHSPTSGQPAQR